MNEEETAIGQLVMIQQIMMHLFIKRLLIRLSNDVPSFDLARFVDEQFLFQEHLPKVEPGAPPQEQSQARIGIREWGKLIEVAEAALSETK